MSPPLRKEDRKPNPATRPRSVPVVDMDFTERTAVPPPPPAMQPPLEDPRDRAAVRLIHFLNQLGLVRQYDPRTAPRRVAVPRD